MLAILIDFQARRAVAAGLALCALAMLGACEPYQPACRLIGAATVLSAPETARSGGLSGGGIALNPEPEGKVLARWWRPVDAPGTGTPLPSGPTAELALFAADGTVEQRSSVFVPGGWEISAGRNPARPFVTTPSGVAAAIAQLRASIEPDLTVRLRSFLSFTTVSSSTGAVATTELGDTSCFDCEVAASLQRLRTGSALLVAHLPGLGGPGASVTGLVMTLDDDGAALAKLDFSADEPLPVLVPRTRTDALALQSGTTLRLWNLGLAQIGPPMGLRAAASAADWDLSSSELVAGSAEATSVFVEYLAWTSPARAERHRASSGGPPYAIARGTSGPGVVFAGYSVSYFAHLDAQGNKRGPDVPLPPLGAEASADDAALREGASPAPLDPRGVLIEVPGAPGNFAYFVPSAAGIDRHEVLCE